MIEYTYINDAEEIKDNISDNKCKIVHMKRKSNGYFINVICCQFSDEEQLKNNWEELVTNVADVVQKNLVKRIEIFNVYIIFFQSEINGVIEDSIEQNKYSSRKLVINKRMPESNCDSTMFLPYNFNNCIIKCCTCRSYRNNRNTCYQPQKSCNYHFRNLFCD